MWNRKLIIIAVIPFLAIGPSACTFPTTELPFQISNTQMPVSTSKPATQQQNSSNPQSKATLSLTADRTNINAGECTQLRWNVKGGYQVQINGNIQSWAGEQQECPTQSTTYSLCVDTGEEFECREVSIVVKAPTLSITADRTNINAGECTQLHWDVKGGYQVQVNEYDQSWTGEQQVCPTQSKTYSLCVDTGEAWECEELSITVNPQQIQNQPPAQPASQPKTSTINVVNNSGAEICGVYIRPTSDPALFNLIPGKTLPNGSSQSFSFPIPDSYQIVIYGCHHNNLILLEEIQLSEGGYICNVPPLVLDLAITDLYPDNTPKGMLVIRITNRGHVMAPQEEISIACDAILTPVPGAFAPAHPMHSEFVNLSAISVGNTNAQTAYMDLDTDSFSYSVTCRITNVPSIFMDPNLANNTYSENIP